MATLADATENECGHAPLESPMLTWEQAFQAGTQVVGGKGWNLGRLSRYGFAVPSGGVLAASVYEQVMRSPQIAKYIAELKAVTADQVSDDFVQQKLTKLREEILSQKLPDDARNSVDQFIREHDLLERPVAVRSSAIAEDSDDRSFAGIHDSFLNVQGTDAICEAVLKCHASLWTSHAVAYRRRFEVDDQGCPCAVVICEMVGDESSGPVAAGVAFSCDPVTGQRGLVTINLARGLGDAIVRGTIDPQQYTVRFDESQALVVRKDTTGDSAILADRQIQELSKVVMRVHWALGEGRDPQDVEWAYDGKTFWVLQARPVTRLPRWTFPGTAHRQAIWSNANVRDSFPNPITTMTWSFMDSSAQLIVYASLRVMGYPIPDGMEILRCFAGRPYFDLDGLQWGMYDAIGIPPAETNRTMGGFQPEIDVPSENPLRGWQGIKRTRRRLRFLRRLWSFHRDASKKINEAIEDARNVRSKNVSALNNKQLLAEFRRIQAVGNEYQPILQLAAAYYGGWMMLMQDLIEKVTGDRGQPLVTRLLASSGDVTSAEQAYRLRELAMLASREPLALKSLNSGDPFAWRELDDDSTFRSAMESYLDEFGHRAVFEMEFASRRWFENPTYLLDQIRFHMEHHDGIDQREHAANVKREAERDLCDVPWFIRFIVRWMLRRTRMGAALRENAKSGSAAGVAMIRHVCLEVGRRLQQARELESADDVFQGAIKGIIMIQETYDLNLTECQIDDNKIKLDIVKVKENNEDDDADELR